MFKVRSLNSCIFKLVLVLALATHLEALSVMYPLNPGEQPAIVGEKNFPEVEDDLIAGKVVTNNEVQASQCELRDGLSSSRIIFECKLTYEITVQETKQGTDYVFKLEAGETLSGYLGNTREVPEEVNQCIKDNITNVEHPNFAGMIEACPAIADVLAEDWEFKKVIKNVDEDEQNPVRKGHELVFQMFTIADKPAEEERLILI